ncbi:hypothetical protein BH24PSE1_BH24PSE1_03950 [soil metagenome]
MENKPPEPQPSATPSLPATRHDGWTGEKMAIFCEALADTAVVAEACDQARMGISGAYALRRRNPAFAAAWDAALTIARERLADTLLARSMEGNVEQLWRDGELVGERHVIDNRLGLAILRRLDRLAETGLSTSSRGVRSPGAPAPCSRPVDWELAVDALRTGDEAAVWKALALFKSNEVEEVEGPPVSLSQGDEDEGLDLSDRCWKDHHGWLTNFPPPLGFTGHESGTYAGDEEYERACTPEEVAILEAEEAADFAAARAEDEALRDAWFEMLHEELEPRATQTP